MYKKKRISPKIQRRRFREIKNFGLGRLPTRATTLQDVEILPAWFISNLRVVLRWDSCNDALRVCLDYVKMVLMTVLQPSCGRLCELFCDWV